MKIWVKLLSNVTIEFALPNCWQRIDWTFLQSPQLVEQLVITELRIKMHGSGPWGPEFKSRHPDQALRLPHEGSLSFRGPGSPSGDIANLGSTDSSEVWDESCLIYVLHQSSFWHSHWATWGRLPKPHLISKLVHRIAKRAEALQYWPMMR